MPIVYAALKPRRGPQNNLPTLPEGEIAVTTDTLRLYIGTDQGNKLIGDGTFVKVSGDTMTGYLTLSNDPTDDLHAVTKRYVDNILGNVVSGTRWKEPVRVASVSNIDINDPPTTIDGVVLNTDDRILLKDQTNAAQNGIYVYKGVGNPLQRASDADSWNEIIGSVVVVLEGIINQDKIFLCTSDPGGSIDTTSITIVELKMFNYIFGNGLSINGNIVSIKPGTAISVDSNGIHVEYDKGLTVDNNNRLTVNIDSSKALNFDNNNKLYLDVDTDVFGFQNGKLVLLVVDGGTW